MNQKQILSVATILLAFATAIYFQPLMPAQMASHWNWQGNVDGYMTKNWALFFFPFLMVAVNILFHFIPKIDPQKKNIDKFFNSYQTFILVFNIFFLYIYSMTIIWNMGFSMNMNAVLMPGFAVLFYFCGDLMKNTKMNYTIGIKLPWTLANETVWDKTHKLGEKLFKLTALSTLLGIFFSQYSLWFVFAPLIISIVYLFIYSYLEYQKVK
ncbi:MAG: SdpI family protein [Minisyncoccales bacterium]